MDSQSHSLQWIGPDRGLSGLGFGCPNISKVSMATQHEMLCCSML